MPPKLNHERTMPDESESKIEPIPEMISIIAPIYNEADSLVELHRELEATLKSWGRRYEILFVNDGSTDATPRILNDLAAADPHVVVIHFRRNYGQTAAMTAGIEHALGGILVPIDADLQNDPADIPALVARLDEGFDVVSGWRRERKDRAISRILPSKAANWLISLISGVQLHDYGCSLKAYRRDVIEGVRLYGEMHRFIPIFAQLQGGKITEQVVRHRPRRHGVSKYGFSRVYKVLLDLLLVKFLASYSAKPIYVFGGFGLACLALSSIPITAAFYFKFTTIPEHQKDFVSTPLPVVAAVFILVGLLALLQGLLAEMLMRTYFESQGKRPYLIREIKRG